MRDRRALAERSDVGHEPADLATREERAMPLRLLARVSDRHAARAQVEVRRECPNAAEARPLPGDVARAALLWLLDPPPVDPVAAHAVGREELGAERARGAVPLGLRMDDSARGLCDGGGRRGERREGDEPRDGAAADSVRGRSALHDC